MASTIVRILWFIFIGWWLGLVWFAGSLVLMGSILLFPIGAYLVTKTWKITTLAESPSKVVVNAQNRNTSISSSGIITTSDSKSTQSGVLYSGRDHDTLPPGSFDHFEFDLTEGAVLDYTVDVLTDDPINVIVTTQDELERFEYREDIRMLEKGSEFATCYVDLRKRLTPGKYAIIVDNTARLEWTNGDTCVDFEIEYEVRS